MIPRLGRRERSSQSHIHDAQQSEGAKRSHTAVDALQQVTHQASVDLNRGLALGVQLSHGACTKEAEDISL